MIKIYIVESYKGFNKDMTCTPQNTDIKFQYEEGKEYETKTAECCESGFHACEMPLDVFRYYKPSTSIYHKVEQGGILSRDGKDTKVASTKIYIGARIDFCGLVKAQIEFVFDKIKKTKEKAKSDKNLESSATSGEESSAATSGNGSSAATSGEESSAATSGNGSSAATSGEESSAATSGDWSSAATSGYRSSAATSGNGSSAATSGEESSAATSNKNAVALACGKNARAKGVVGAYIVLTEWNDEADELLNAQMVRIDGKKYKPDTWYTIRDGEIIESED